MIKKTNQIKHYLIGDVPRTRTIRQGLMGMMTDEGMVEDLVVVLEEIVMVIVERTETSGDEQTIGTELTI